MTMFLAFWRVVNGFVDFVVECFLANTILISITVRNFFITNHVDAVDRRVKSQ